MADLILTITALLDQVIDDYKSRCRELTCEVHRSSRQPTRCAICALVEARVRYRNRVSSEGRPAI